MLGQRIELRMNLGLLHSHDPISRTIARAVVSTPLSLVSGMPNLSPTWSLFSAHSKGRKELQVAAFGKSFPPAPPASSSTSHRVRHRHSFNASRSHCVCPLIVLQTAASSSKLYHGERRECSLLWHRHTYSIARRTQTRLFATWAVTRFACRSIHAR